MADLSGHEPEHDGAVVSIATLRCRPCRQAGVDTSIVLQVPTWAKVGDCLSAMCPKCILRPSAPLLAEESGIFEVVEVRTITVQE
jgi:hypothetical protein